MEDRDVKLIGKILFIEAIYDFSTIQFIVLFNAMHCLPDLPTFCQQTVQHPVAEDGPARYESHFSPWWEGTRSYLAAPTGIPSL